MKKLTQKELDIILAKHKLHSDTNRKQGEKADLSDTNCSGLDFSGKNCKGIDFTFANCRDANFTDANCGDTDFTDAKCWKANFTNTKLPFYKNIPEEGSFIAWKKLDNDYLAKILITEDAKRCSNLVSQQGRTDKIKILAIYDKEGKETLEEIECLFTNSDQSYKTGETYTTELNENFRVCYIEGFHFFMSKEEAEEAEEFGK